MSTYTENYSLVKPEEADYYDVTDFNENFDTIDSVMAMTEAETNGISEKIGNTDDTGSDTVFGKLNQMANSSPQGLTAIKSIQRVVYTLNTSDSSGSKTINTVNPNNCIVIFERLQDSSTNTDKVVYTLSANKVTFAFSGTGNKTVIFGLWIIEFC
ncbi:MAG: hypothetical protein II993_02395 [Anaerotignum sp.]|nr:hypothetical protein [Anaerotignum sp.]